METGLGRPTEAESGENFPGREELYENAYVDIYHSKKQGIPIEEGVQLVVDPKEETVLGEARAAWFSLAVAKVVAEGRFTEEFWANIQDNAHPGVERGLNVWGRHPQSAEAWGKPVNIREPSEREIQNLDEQEREKLQRTLELYIPKWGSAGEHITLFKNGVNAVDPQKQEFINQREKGVEGPWPWQAYTAWMSDKYELTVVMQPHIKGVHLVLSPLHQHWSEAPRDDFWTPNMGVKQILEEQGEFFNGDIHFSGNWGFAPLDVSPDKPGRRVDERYLEESDPEKMEDKRKQTKTALGRGPWMGPEKGGWAAHGHYYATDSPDKYVSLPSRSKSERPEEWEGIPEMNREQAESISQLIQARLNQWLQAQQVVGAKLFSSESEKTLPQENYK
ncbi:MAG: hypothetical protein HW405_114 [Candidatus Berkelbacteria bacterium]|nr:hypothetical protein [Candidatus Berkelbacteria bacterium]